jgi:hypothetical protein
MAGNREDAKRHLVEGLTLTFIKPRVHALGKKQLAPPQHHQSALIFLSHLEVHGGEAVS